MQRVFKATRLMIAIHLTYHHMFDRRVYSSQAHPYRHDDYKGSDVQLLLISALASTA